MKVPQAKKRDQVELMIPIRLVQTLPSQLAPATMIIGLRRKRVEASKVSLAYLSHPHRQHQRLYQHPHHQHRRPSKQPQVNMNNPSSLFHHHLHRVLGHDPCHWYQDWTCCHPSSSQELLVVTQAQDRQSVKRVNQVDPAESVKTVASLNELHSL